MTAAVCIACGAMKVGAWTPCPACKHDATTDLERAKALLLSEKNLDAAGLAAASAGIKAGQPPIFDEEQLTALAAGITNAPLPSKALVYVAAVGFLLVVTAVGFLLIFSLRWLLHVVL